jgi:hypothetical protein
MTEDHEYFENKKPDKTYISRRFVNTTLLGALARKRNNVRSFGFRDNVAPLLLLQIYILPFGTSKLARTHKEQGRKSHLTGSVPSYPSSARRIPATASGSVLAAKWDFFTLDSAPRRSPDGSRLARPVSTA